MSTNNFTRGQLDILLIGKTGNGKSALGNSILRRKAFKSVPSPNSVTKEIQYEYTDYNGRCIKIVDGPGIGDTDLNQEDALKLVIKNVNKAIAANPEGYHAFFLVVRFGGRFTNEDVQTIDALKAIFGDTFVDFCILVVTCGDNFDPDETCTDSFEQWCSMQTGVFKKLVDECKNRVILFDNRTKDNDKQIDQLNRLISMVDKLSSMGLRYSGEHFTEAQKKRERLLVEAKLPYIKEETFKETSLIIEQLGRVQKDLPEAQLVALDGLKARVEKLHRGIIEEDKSTGALRAIIQTVEHVQQCVNEQITSARETIELMKEKAQRQAEIERMKAKREKEMREMDEALRRELEEKISLMEKQQRENAVKMESMERTLRKKTAEVEAEYQKLKETKTLNFIDLMGAIVANIVPVFQALFESDDSDHEDSLQKMSIGNSKRLSIKDTEID